MAHTRALICLFGCGALFVAILALLPGCGHPDGSGEQRMEGSGAPVSDMAFSPDGKTLAVCYDTDTQTTHYAPPSGHAGEDNLRLFDARTGALRQTRTLQDGGPGHPSEIAFSPDGRQIAGAAPFGIDILTRDSHAPAVATPGDPYREKDGTMTVSWSQWNPGHPFFGPNQTLIAYGIPAQSDGSGTFVRTVWSAISGRLLSHQTLSLGPDTQIDQIAPSPDGRQVLALFSRLKHLSKTEVEMTSSGEGLIFDGATGKPTAKFSALSDARSGEGATAFSPDEKYVAAEDGEGRCLVHDLATGTVVRMMTSLRAKAVTDGVRYVNYAGPSVLAFSPDDRWLAAGRFDGKVKLYSLTTGLPVHAWQSGDAPVKQVLFSPDSSSLAASDDGGTVHLWKVAAP